MIDLMQGLNDNQRRAVTSTAPVILTVAGAGSGKTTVLTRRIANLNINHRVGTIQILALTFTRLAGKEMKERAMKLVGEEQGKKLWVGTFHAFSVSVLRRWGKKLGIDDNFTIYDQEDREEILKQIIEEYGNLTTLKKVLDRHEHCGDYREEQQKYPEECRVLMEYGYRCKQNNAVDLDRLIDLVIRLWEICPESLAEYQQNYTHVFVDEFQDTSDNQIRLLKLLSPQNLFVVGDPDQAIYGWRNAKIEYIVNFEKLYPGCEVIKLEDNYRSTREIVKAANSLIEHNQQRLDKTLIAHKDGMEIVTGKFPSPYAEATNIAELIQGYNHEGKAAYKDIAVLARTNRQIDYIAEILANPFNVPVHRVSGKDDPYKSPAARVVLNWMYFLQNKKDNMAFKKCARQFGITDTQVEKLSLNALTQDFSLYEGLPQFTGPFEAFAATIRGLDKKTVELNSPLEHFEIIKEAMGVSNPKQIEKAEDAIKVWETSKLAVGENTSVQAFLKYLRYRDIQEKLIEERDAVKLMTVHAAKGLEFGTVIVVGMNQGLFPSKKGDIEEERRLCYVAATRAKSRLFITWPENVQDWNGSLVKAKCSQFINEMGVEL